MSLMQKPLGKLSVLLKNKQVSPLELARECLERVRQTEPLVNAYISVLEVSASCGSAAWAVRSVGKASTSILRCLGARRVGTTGASGGLRASLIMVKVYTVLQMLRKLSITTWPKLPHHDSAHSS